METDRLITNPEIEDYLHSLLPSTDKVLSKMEELAAKRDFPIVGPLVGRFFYQLAKLSGAEKILELGSGFGYSAYWFAKALGENGSVTCTESDRENTELAKKFFKEGGVSDKISIITCNALDYIKASDETYDIIFNDIDKHQYPAVPDLAFPRLKKGGLLVSDNVLWFGRILDTQVSEETQGVKDFTNKLLSHNGFFTSVIPLRDGISLSIKSKS